MYCNDHSHNVEVTICRKFQLIILNLFIEDRKIVLVIARCDNVNRIFNNLEGKIQQMLQTLTEPSSFSIANSICSESVKYSAWSLDAAAVHGQRFW